MHQRNRTLLRRRRVPQPRNSLAATRPSASLSPRGASLIEVLLVVAITGILISMSVPSFHRSIEQTHADIAAANLRAVWAAERLYWLEYRSYTADLSVLESLGLLDPTIVSVRLRYVYAIPSAGSSTFRATATRTGSSRWSGQFTIGEDGVLSGAVRATGEPNIVPGFQ